MSHSDDLYLSIKLILFKNVRSKNFTYKSSIPSYVSIYSWEENLELLNQIKEDGT